MTRKQVQKSLAKAARTLAKRLVRGRPIKLRQCIAFEEGEPGCIMGHVVAKANVLRVPTQGTIYSGIFLVRTALKIEAIPEVLGAAIRRAEHLNDEGDHGRLPDALVDLADILDLLDFE